MVDVEAVIVMGEEKAPTGDVEQQRMKEAEEKEMKPVESLALVLTGETLEPLNAKKVKLEIKEKREKKQKVDEDEIQKMQILVSSFSEEQLNRYEMYRRSAFPKAAIKRVKSMVSFNILRF
ncbi:hypothetical protein GDO81_006157 [Engystomops pustulosus]|uniref:TAFII28-like protein domain-containing protein n=1 Tax=Engystomops pustulosus TaxID=76066 RepID=A0AAV7CUW2_ENGPU|nr:hypothetical protein GDO81_006157 [Engystomops pustulosus]